MLLRPRWLAWHATAAIVIAGMLVLFDWQLHRALSGNELSWAYTVEWPLFAIFAVYFWVKSLRDEVRLPQGRENAHEQRNGAGDAAVSPSADDYVARLKDEVRSHGRWHGWR
jgi:hypothetical protein